MRKFIYGLWLRFQIWQARRALRKTVIRMLIAKGKQPTRKNIAELETALLRRAILTGTLKQTGVTDDYESTSTKT